MKEKSDLGYMMLSIGWGFLMVMGAAAAWGRLIGNFIVDILFASG